MRELKKYHQMMGVCEAFPLFGISGAQDFSGHKIFRISINAIWSQRFSSFEKIDYLRYFLRNRRRHKNLVWLPMKFKGDLSVLGMFFGDIMRNINKKTY